MDVKIWATALLGGLYASLAQSLAETDPAAAYPPAQQPWSQRDYTDFYFVHWNGNNALPHLREEPARTVFGRMVDPGNITRILENSGSADVKYREMKLLLMALGEIRASYNYQVVMGEPLQEELARIQAFSLRVLRELVLLAARLDEPPANTAWTTTLLGIFQSLSERKVYSARQIAALSQSLADYYPALRPLLSEDDKKTLRAKLKRLAASELNPAAREAQSRLLDIMLEQRMK